MKVALLTMNPWMAPEGTHRPFSLAVWRLKATVPEVDARVFDANDWTVDQWVQALEDYDPDVVAASAYLWSLPTWLAVLERLRRPGRLLVLGGPSARPEMLDLEPWRAARPLLDGLCVGEGEHVLPRLVLGEPLQSIEGMAWFDDGWKRSPPAPRMPMDDLPSPYRMGLVPAGTLGQLETYRGCPMSCDFCQWGVLSPSRQALSTEALVEELRALKALDSPGLFSVDVALNLHGAAFRNLAAAEREVGFLAEKELFCEVYPSKLTEEHLDFLSGTRATVGLGLQSMDAQLMRDRGRPFTLGRFEDVVDRLAGVAKTTVEIIVGLPGSSPELFWKTLEYARQLPVSLRVFEYLVLPDAGLRHVQRDGVDFDPYTLRMNGCTAWPRELYRETLEQVHQMAVESGGWLTHNWPLPTELDTPPAPLGRPIAGPMWAIPDADHEALHRVRPDESLDFPKPIVACPGSDLKPGLLEQVHAGALSGVVVHKLLKPPVCAELVRRLDRLELPRHPLGSRFAGETLGLGLDHAVDGLDDYFADQDRMLPAVRRLFGRRPLDTVLLEVLRRLSHRPVEVPMLRGRPCTPFTVRRLPEGGCIPPHIELEQTTRPPYAELAPLLDGQTVLSFLLVLQPADTGGVLRLHDVGWEDLDDEHWVRGRTRADDLLAKARSKDVPLDVGDLLIFDGGRAFHEVTAVHGERWTVGGFIAGSSDGSTFLTWC